MCQSPQSDRDRFRILLFRNHTREILVEARDDGFGLPVLAIPKHSRIAKELAAAIEDLWSLTAYCLFSLPSNTASECYQIAEAFDTDAAAPLGTNWFPLASLADTEFGDRLDCAAIQISLTTLDRYRRNELQGFFGEPGWLLEVTRWVKAEAARAGLCLTGKFQQWNACPTFSLIRFETDGPALWFKAVGEPNLHEYRITLGLVHYFPAYLPRLVASNRDWNAWLCLEVEGEHLTEQSRIDTWLTAVTELANLQIASDGNGLHLIELGCRDVRARSLLHQVRPFFDCMAELMRNQKNATPSPLTLSEIDELAGEISKALEEFNESGIPNVLGHLDCSPGNILVSRERATLLDWAEGCVGHPFFTFQYLLEHWRRFHGTDANTEKTILSAYATPWESFVSRRAIAADFQLVPLLAAFAYAASSPISSKAADDPETAAFLRSLTRRMKRELDALRHRRLVCVL
jgi:hypothetical protein